MRFFWILALLCCAGSGRAQSDSLQAEAFLQHAKTCLSAGKADSALLLHKVTLDLFRRQNRLKPWLRSYASMAYTWADDLNQPFYGTDYIEQGLAEMAKWRQPATAPEWEQLVLLYNAAGHIRRSNASDFVGARNFYEQAYHIFEERLHGQSDKIARYLYHNLGNIYTRFGDYQRAENLLQKGVAYGNAHPHVGMADQADLAIVLMQTHQYEAALKTVSEGLRLKSASPDGVVSMLQNQAMALHKLGRSTEALAKLRSIPLRIRQLSVDDDSLYYTMINLSTEAEIRADLQQYPQAIALYHKAIEAGEAHWGTQQRREIAKQYCALGTLRLRQQKHQEALANFHRALQCVLKDFKANNPNQLPDAAYFISENTIMEALEGKAQVFLALGLPEKALQCHELIPVAASRLIATHAYESSSLLTLEEARTRFDQAIDIAWQLYQQNGQMHFAERAFALTEQARAVLLLQSLAKAQRDFNLPADVRAQEQTIAAKMAWYQQQIAAEEQLKTRKSTERLKQLKQALFYLTQEKQRFEDRIRREFADYAGLSEQIQFLNAPGVPALLQNDQALIDYYLTNTDVYIFYFNRGGLFSTRKASLPPLFRDHVQRFFGFMNAGNEKPEDKKWFQQMAFDLYGLLLQPELQADSDRPERLLIVPDDALVFIPFDILLTAPATAETRWPYLEYLLKTHSVGYAYSATLLAMQQDISRKHRSQPAPKYTFAGFAPSYGSTAPPGPTRSVHIPDSLIYDIKSTQQELNRVHALTGGQAFPGPQATEQQFKNIAPDCGILLLAMHGLANDEHPELSCLLFGRPKGDSINNDVLFANELQIMHLQADLAVLSACHTGFGKMHKGEGVFSLARAFAIAGVPSTVMSLWRLHESTAPDLVEAFFKHLKNGATKDEALRRAKMEFLAKKANYDITHPFFWAGVSVSGDMCALESATKWYWWALGGGALLLLLLYLRKKSYKL